MMKSKKKSTLQVIYYIGGRSPEYYAWTLGNVLLDEFLEQRNRDLFYVKEVDLSDSDSDGLSFMSTYSNLKLTTDVLYDGTYEIRTVTTIKESEEMSNEYNTIIAIIDDIRSLLDGIGEDNICKRKYVKVLRSIINAIFNINSRENGLVAEVNTFRLFYDLHKKTFAGEIDDGP